MFEVGDETVFEIFKLFLLSFLREYFFSWFRWTVEVLTTEFKISFVEHLQANFNKEFFDGWRKPKKWTI